MGKIRYFGKKIKSIAIFSGFYLAFCKILTCVWQFFNSVRHIFVPLNGQVLNKYSSHPVTLLQMQQ